MFRRLPLYFSPLLRSLLFAIVFLCTSLTFSQQPGGYLRISNVMIEGNDVTQDKIILRELLFSAGDSILHSEFDRVVEESKQNLLNSSLFNYVYISVDSSVVNDLVVNVKVEERWYLWPYPILEHADRNLSSFLYNGDWYRMNYGMFLVKYNFRGRKEILKVKLRLGYREQYGIVYEVPYLDLKQHHGLYFEAYYFRQKEIICNQNDHVPVYSRSDSYIFWQQRAYVGYKGRYRYNLYQSFKIGYNAFRVEDTVISVNQDFLGSAQNQVSFLSLDYNIELDKRDSRIYPLKGYYISLGLTQSGLHVLNSNYNFGKAKFQVKVFAELANRLYFQTSFTSKLNTAKSDYPFILDDALGYEYYIRGYENYIINGQSFYMLKTAFNYALISPKVKEIEKLPLDKFNKISYAVYFNVFYENGYVNANSTYHGQMLNKGLQSIGAGLNLVTYYDWVFRAEFSWNSLNQKGFFFNLGAPI